MSWTVLITAPGMVHAGERAIALLREAGCQLVVPETRATRNAEELLPLLAGCDAVIAAVEPYTARVLPDPAAARLKVISRWGVGYDSVDLHTATAQGITVTNTPGLLDEAVADYTFALLLALARRIPDGHASVTAGQWSPVWGCDVAGKTLGIVGCGRIGLAVARRAAGFNLRLLASDPSPPEEGRALGIEFVSLDQLLAESDFVSLHTALTPGTRGLIGEAQLRRMKRTALLINAARGALLDEPALTRALREGWIAGAALDVFGEEPLPASHPFRSTPNLLLTPHQASFALDTGARVSAQAAQAVLDALQGRSPRFIVNPQVTSQPHYRLSPHA